MIKEKDIIIKLFTALHPTIKIYLFGSYARGDFTEISDIDIAVDAGQKLTRKELSRLINILEALNIPHKIDLVDMHRIEETFKSVILKESIEWKH